ncbi:DUF5076 domain-containing protein [Sphingopyxis sp. Root1497]|uniref:DUF5076 domain-containing protein n=1 Tax=Sphingopyxis sp. Root1497 TaxID=1736474 RepID=UPI0008AB21B6|nr:MAG: hypothetical protein A2885_19005 [Sphingopyxis sp. RIFCSPHIGHO2_01_FULL_65_24]
MFGRRPEHPHSVPLTGHAELDDRYHEVARFWVSTERSFVLVAPDVVNSPALLGSLLVECMHTAAAGYAATGSFSEEEALSELWKGFDEERSRIESPDQTERAS